MDQNERRERLNAARIAIFNRALFEAEPGPLPWAIYYSEGIPVPDEVRGATEADAVREARDAAAHQAEAWIDKAAALEEVLADLEGRATVPNVEIERIASDAAEALRQIAAALPGLGNVQIEALSAVAIVDRAVVALGAIPGLQDTVALLQADVAAQARVLRELCAVLRLEDDDRDWLRIPITAEGLRARLEAVEVGAATVDVRARMDALEAAVRALREVFA
jgi:hypothetical protein